MQVDWTDKELLHLATLFIGLQGWAGMHYGSHTPRLTRHYTERRNHGQQHELSHNYRTREG